MENKTRELRKKFVVQAIVNKIEKESPGCKIKTDFIPGYPNPAKLVNNDKQDEGFVPDLVSETDGKQNIYEVELDENEYSPKKWRLFSLFSRKANGDFNIVVPENKLDGMKYLLTENKISAKLIYFT